MPERDPTNLRVAAALAATWRRVTRERDAAVLRAWKDGWNLVQLGRATGLGRYRVARIVKREMDRDDAGRAGTTRAG